MSTQAGTFFLGTFGYPIEIALGTDLTNATGVQIKLHKPGGTIVTRDLTTAAITDAVAGTVVYAPIESDVDIAGAYQFELIVTGTGKALQTDGDFTIACETCAPELVVEDGTSKPDANSYASLDDAKTYNRGHLYSNWYATNDDQKIRALIMATRVLEAGVLWNGQRKTDEQALGWPRNYAPQPGTRIAVMTLASLWPHRFWAFWPNDSIPLELKQATCEMARELLKLDRTDLDSEKKGVKSVGLGQGAIQVTLDSSDRKAIFPDMVRLLLKPFGMILTPKSSNVPVQVG